MPKQLWKNIGGVWTPASNVWINVGGVWKDKVIPWTNVGGVWKDCMAYPNVTYSMNITTPAVCTQMGSLQKPGADQTLSHNVVLAGLPVGNTVDVSLRFYGGMTFVESNTTVTYSIYAYIIKNSIAQPSLNYVDTGSKGSAIGAYYFLDSTKTLYGITSSDTIIINRTFIAQQNSPEDHFSNWWGSSLCTLSVTHASGVPINLVQGINYMDLQQICN